MTNRVVRNVMLGVSWNTPQSISLPQSAKVLGVSKGYGCVDLITVQDPTLPYSLTNRRFLVVQGGVYFEAPMEKGEGARMEYIGSVDKRNYPQNSPPYESDLLHVFELIPIN